MNLKNSLNLQKSIQVFKIKKDSNKWNTVYDFSPNTDEPNWSLINCEEFNGFVKYDVNFIEIDTFKV